MRLSAELREFLEEKGCSDIRPARHYTGGYASPRVRIWPATYEGLPVVVKQKNDGPAIRREMRVLRRLSGVEGIPRAYRHFSRRFYDGTTPETWHFLIQDRVAGDSLWSLIERGEVTPEQVLSSVDLAASIAESVHDKYLAHGDLALRNVMSKGGIIDFEFGGFLGTPFMRAQGFNLWQVPEEKRRVVACRSKDLDTHALGVSLAHGLAYLFGGHAELPGYSDTAQTLKEIAPLARFDSLIRSKDRPGDMDAFRGALESLANEVL